MPSLYYGGLTAFAHLLCSGLLSKETSPEGKYDHWRRLIHLLRCRRFRMGYRMCRVRNILENLSYQKQLESGKLCHDQHPAMSNDMRSSRILPTHHPLATCAFFVTFQCWSVLREGRPTVVAQDKRETTFSLVHPRLTVLGPPH